MKPQDSIEDWMIEQGHASDRDRVLFDGFEDLGGSVMGRCTYGIYTAGARMGCLITLDRAWVGHPGIARDAVLWHETCHAISWLEMGEGGHGAGWIRQLLRHPELALIDWLIAPILYIIYRRP